MIVSHTFGTPAASQPLLKTCYAARLYRLDGIFSTLFTRPQSYYDGESKVIVTYIGKHPIAVLHVGNGCFYGWDKEFDSCYGMLGVFTKKEFRNQGIATAMLKKLFEANPHENFTMLASVFDLVPSCFAARAFGLIFPEDLVIRQVGSAVTD